MVRVGTGNFCSEQLLPSPFSTGVRGGESLVELLVEDLGGAAELGWPGGPQVAGVDLGGGAPHLQVGDQLGRKESTPTAAQADASPVVVAADLVGELSNKL